jgi:hypothetical protein
MNVNISQKRHFKIGARGCLQGKSKTQTLKGYARLSESWESVKDGYEQMEKFIILKDEVKLSLVVDLDCESV